MKNKQSQIKMFNEARNMSDIMSTERGEGVLKATKGGLYRTNNDAYRESSYNNGGMAFCFCEKIIVPGGMVISILFAKTVKK